MQAAVSPFCNVRDPKGGPLLSYFTVAYCITGKIFIANHFARRLIGTNPSLTHISVTYLSELSWVVIFGLI